MPNRDLNFNLNTSGDTAAAAAFLRVAAAVETLNREMKRVNDNSSLVNNAMQKTTKVVSDAAAAQKTMEEFTAKNTKAQKDQEAQLKKLEQSFKNADRGMNGLLTTALALGPALIPIGTVGAAAIAGLAPAAGTALLAFLGLRQAWKDGTLQATGLGKQISIFRGEFEHLKSIAAGGVLPGFGKALQELRPIFPELNRTVALFSTQMGTITAKVAPGLVTIFAQLQPLFQTFGNVLVGLADKFEHWATTTGAVKTFVAYAQTQLPAVLSTIEALVTAAGKVVAGFAPFGSTSLLAIKLLAQAIYAIPVGVLQVLIPLITGLALGIKALKEAQAAASGLQLLAGKIGTAGVGARGASGFVSGLGKAVGFLGPVGVAAGVGLGILSTVLGRHSQAAQEAQQRTNDLTKALQDGNLRFVLYTQLVKSGAIPAADALGISQKTIYDATTRTGSGMADLRAKLFEATGRYAELSAATQQSATINSGQAKTLGDLRIALENVSAGVQQAQKDYDAAKQSTAEYAKAQGDAALGADILSGKTASTAAALGLTEDAYINGKLASDKKTASDQAATAQMTLEGNAAGLLTQQMNTLTDATLGASDANLGFKLANLQLQSSLLATHGDLRLTTQAGLQNNQAVNQAIRLAEQDGEALAKKEQKTKTLSVATADGTNKTLADLRALRDTIVAHHGNADAVQALINKLTNYNNKPIPVKPAKVDGSQIPPAILKAQDSINSLHGNTVKVNIEWSGPGGIPGPAAARSPGATGGYITGPGTATSDSIPLWGSTGEFMMRAAAVSKYGVGFMQNLNAMKFAQGGPIILQLPSGEQTALNSWTASQHPVWNIAAPGGGGAGTSTPGAFSGSQLAWVFAAENATGTPASWTAAILRRIMFESGGNPNAINNWDINAQRGDPSRGLMQTIMSTFLGFHQPGTSFNIYDPVANIAAAINYIKSRYGSIFAIDPPVQGYANGGVVDRTGLAFLHRGEEVLPSGYRGGGGVTVMPGAITVYAAPGMDEGRVAQQALSALKQWVADEQRKAAKGARA